MFDNDYIERPDRYHSFIVFEPASLRVHDGDILLIGDSVREFYDSLMIKLLKQDKTLKTQILHNKLVKLGHMLELLTNYDQVIITRYFDRIWRRYSYISHLGENFLNLDSLYDFFPKYKKQNDIIASRFGDFDDEEDSDDGGGEVSSEDESKNVIDSGV